MQITRQQWFMAESLYCNEVLSRYLRYPLTPAMIARAQQDVDQTQRRLSMTETAPVWKIPVKVVVDLTRQSMGVEPDLADLAIVE